MSQQYEYFQKHEYSQFKKYSWQHECPYSTRNTTISTCNGSQILTAFYPGLPAPTSYFPQPFAHTTTTAGIPHCVSFSFSPTTPIQRQFKYLVPVHKTDSKNMCQQGQIQHVHWLLSCGFQKTGAKSKMLIAEVPELASQDICKCFARSHGMAWQALAQATWAGYSAPIKSLN